MNLDQKMKIRCPSCTRLYEVQSTDIHSESPIFECISCDTRFTFEYPPVNLEMIPCFLIPKVLFQGVTENPLENDTKQRVNFQSGEMRACPKCAALNSRKAKECYSCHVIFEKLEGLPGDRSLGAQPSLVRKWKGLLESFQNESLHEDFIRSCQRLEALKFALVKYEDLRKAQGEDPQCDQMIARVNALMLVGTQQKEQSSKGAHPKWRKYLYWGPFGLSALLILIGMMNIGHRNLVGVGVALGVMMAGLIVMIKGRISVSDFLN